MIEWNKIQLLVVDMDNTLADTLHTLTHRQWELVASSFEKKGRKKIAEAFRERAGKQSFVSMLDDLDLTKNEVTFAVQRYDDNPVDALKLFSDVDAIFGLSVRKVLLSRGEPELQKRKIAHLKLQDKFNECFIVDTFTSKLKTLKSIMRKYNVDPHEVLVIGDRLAEEISDGDSLGMQTLHVKRPDAPEIESDVTPGMVITDLNEIAKHLQ